MRGVSNRRTLSLILLSIALLCGCSSGDGGDGGGERGGSSTTSASSTSTSADAEVPSDDAAVFTSGLEALALDIVDRHSPMLSFGDDPERCWLVSDGLIDELRERFGLDLAAERSTGTSILVTEEIQATCTFEAGELSISVSTRDATDTDEAIAGLAGPDDEVSSFTIDRDAVAAGLPDAEVFTRTGADGANLTAAWFSDGTMVEIQTIAEESELDLEDLLGVLGAAVADVRTTFTT